MENLIHFKQLLDKAFEDQPSVIFRKGDLLIREGEVEKNVYLIKSGLVRVFLLSEHEEQVIRFGYKGSMINSLNSFLKRTPSEFYLESLRKTYAKVMSREQFFELVNSSERSLRGYAKLLESGITQHIEREMDLLTASPTERLARVLTRSPNLFQEVPLKYIASYLRMTPETLSRIRHS